VFKFISIFGRKGVLGFIFLGFFRCSYLFLAEASDSHSYKLVSSVALTGGDLSLQLV
jgi:hypothetical protein